MKGFFGDLFDFNHDGNLDGLERAADFALFAALMDDDEKKTELELSGLELDELEVMDADERREALEEAGLDPDDYGF
jgi:hypothetical protein